MFSLTGPDVVFCEGIDVRRRRMTAFLDRSAAFEAGQRRIGNKAWNLARLDRWGFRTTAGRRDRCGRL